MCDPAPGPGGVHLLLSGWTPQLSASPAFALRLGREPPSLPQVLSTWPLLQAPLPPGAPSLGIPPLNLELSDTRERFDSRVFNQEAASHMGSWALDVWMVSEELNFGIVFHFH